MGTWGVEISSPDAPSWARRPRQTPKDTEVALGINPQVGNGPQVDCSSQVLQGWSTVHTYSLEALLSSCRRTGRALLRLQDWTWCYRAAACSKPQPHAAAHARRPRCCSCLGDEPTPSPRAPPGWAPPLPSWRGVGSAQPARLPLFPSPAVADQAPGVAGAEQLRAREALQPDTLGPIFALGPGAVLD